MNLKVITIHFFSIKINIIIILILKVLDRKKKLTLHKDGLINDYVKASSKKEANQLLVKIIKLNSS